MNDREYAEMRTPETDRIAIQIEILRQINAMQVQTVPYARAEETKSYSDKQ